VLSSYRYLSTGLIKGLELMGVETEVQPSHHPSEAEKLDDPVCFVAPSAYEITHGGKKLLGSAQTRRKNAILQHGTLPLTGDIARICEVLVYADEPSRQQAARQVLDRATTLEHASARIVSWDEAAQAMVDGLACALGIEFTEAPATTAELRRAEVLAFERYQNSTWTERV
jgi:lipoate-protein ligase A